MVLNFFFKIGSVVHALRMRLHSQRFGMSQDLRSTLTVLYIGKLETTHTETLHIPPRTGYGYLTKSQISVLTVKGLECPRTYTHHSKLGVNTDRVFVIMIYKYVRSLVWVYA